MKKFFIISVLTLILLLTPLTIACSFSKNKQGTNHNIQGIKQEEVLFSNSDCFISLPPPYLPSMILEEAIARRMSIREFKDKDITMENISSILWSAYGYVNGNRSLESIDGRNVIKIYVLMASGVYVYVPSNHSLKQIRRFDFRWIGLYDTASIKLGLVLDRSMCKNESIAAAEIGMIGQNVYLMVNSLGLGTVTTAQKTNQLYFIGLPLDEKPLIIMPIGYPTTDYDFSYDPYESELPFPQNSTVSFVDAISYKSRWAFLSGNLSLTAISQILWSAYGTSYLFDNVGQKRHRSVPSSHATYPLEILFANGAREWANRTDV